MYGIAGGLIELNNGGPKPLQYVATAAFLANLFADYMDADGVPGWNCGPTFYPSSTLRSFATSQVLFVLPLSIHDSDTSGCHITSPS